ncbi:MAG: hypothetical protein ABIL09_29925 [Gemmatimonadota bacterium]
MRASQTSPRLLGITVLGDYLLNEGIDGILDNLVERAGATAVAVNPTVTAPAAAGQGSFQPPTDAGSSPRLFDRPLWGQRALWVRSGPSYSPRPELYADTPYRPRPANDLTAAHGRLIGDFIDAALDRGLEVYFQVSGTRPPALRDEDHPLLPDGRRPEDRMADCGCLASGAIRAYVRAHVRDLLEAYPRITGFRPDWPEYPCYKLDEAFQDFGPAVAAWAGIHGFDFAAARDDALRLYRHLHGGLANRDLEDLAGADRGKVTQVALLRRYPGVLEWLRLKAALSVDLLQGWRAALTEAGGADKRLSANAFMPPFTLATGFDFAGAGTCCDAASPKLYTMHWCAMVVFWGEVLRARNPGLDEALLVRALAQLFDLADAPWAERLSDYHYPEPDEPHPVPDGAQERKIGQALAEAGGRLAVTPLVHGYGPLDDFARRFRVVARSRAQGAWLNRYGYLSDAKLDAVGQAWREASGG